MIALDETRLYQVGDEVGPYRVVEPLGFCGVLPVAVIRQGHANAGVRVILTSPYSGAVIEAEA